jgi:hypothetical protein
MPPNSDQKIPSKGKTIPLIHSHFHFFSTLPLTLRIRKQTPDPNGSLDHAAGLKRHVDQSSYRH